MQRGRFLLQFPPLKEKMMNKVYALLFAVCVFVVLPGCGSKENTLATDGATAEDFAKYEAELAAVTASGNEEK